MAVFYPAIWICMEKGMTLRYLERAAFGGKYMKTGTMKMLLVAGFVVIVLLLLWIFCYAYVGLNSDNVELLHETSPGGDYVLDIVVAILSAYYAPLGIIMEYWKGPVMKKGLNQPLQSKILIRK